MHTSELNRSKLGGGVVLEIKDADSTDTKNSYPSTDMATTDNLSQASTLRTKDVPCFYGEVLV